MNVFVTAEYLSKIYHLRASENCFCVNCVRSDEC